MPYRRSRILALAGLCAVAAGAASGGGLGLGGAPLLPAVTNGLGTLTNRTTGLVDQSLNTVVRDTVGRPDIARVVERDAGGYRVVRGEVLALSPSDKSLAIAKGLNFEVVREDRLDALDLNVTVLRVPDGMDAKDALDALRKADPGGIYDVDHIYDPSSSTARAVATGAGSATAVSASQIHVGMIDGGIDRRRDAFEHATIVSKGFVANGAPVATQHGTAVASLLVGSDADVSGALPGATLYAADVYCGQASGGSADAIASALGWFAASGVPVVNISLSGPPNGILAAAVNAFVKRGHVLVAAVGNDGPAAGIEYPAGYPGVAGITSVDDSRGIQIEANQGADIAFAAEGVNVTVATPDGHRRMTGTSFASPIAAARFALLMPRPDPRLSAQAWTTLEHAALHLGPPGRNDIFGYGFLDRPHSVLHRTAAR